MAHFSQRAAAARRWHAGTGTRHRRPSPRPRLPPQPAHVAWPSNLAWDFLSGWSESAFLGQAAGGLWLLSCAPLPVVHLESTARRSFDTALGMLAVDDMLGLAPARAEKDAGPRWAIPAPSCSLLLLLVP
ncbi:hypothetical protein AOQ84DRAFT_223212 [Glonium stellatum]|uniref:Uncharacterized protein n=1 Tax=Glonium stellatum TaxID=574774 RepID=A0A8E2JRM5_9PEZI|nr:hypothetical protein AOQ84DRAFT_223212 [Glonium stellatum]